MEAPLHDLDSVRRSKPISQGGFTDISQTPNPDHTFVLGGEQFTHRGKVGANLIARFYDAPEGITTVCPHCSKDFSLGSLRPQQDALAAADAMILAFLEPGQEDKWAKVRADDAAEPLTILEVIATGNYLLGAITARPTEQQSGSGSTSETAGTNSTETLPSQVPA